MAIVFLGLGSNLGNRQRNLINAVEKLAQEGMEILLCSNIIETNPVGGPPQGKYLNAVIKVRTHLTPLKLLATTQAIEHDLGRLRTVINGPRVIDIDILLYDHLTLIAPQLMIPHPHMLERDFVMIPLKEIAPEVVEELSHARR